MIETSDAYKKLVKSNIRPKCEPIIKVYGEDNTGKETEIIWKASNIKDLKYKRGIDPVGRELPYMELTWTEIYTGKLNAENYPEKYNNIVKYMAVELSFVQNLGFYNVWKTLYDLGETWKNLFSLGKTWKELKNNVLQETLKFPTLFLTARPTISGQTITWTARDLLYFLTEKTINAFPRGVDFGNPLRFLVLSERANVIKKTENGNFITQKAVWDGIQKTDAFFDYFNKTNDLSPIEGVNSFDRIVFNGSTNQLLMMHLATRNYYLDFKENGIDVFSISNKQNFSPIYEFNGLIMYEKPKVTNGRDVSAYSFKSYSLIDEEEEKTMKNTGEITIGGKKFYRFDYDGYGKALSGVSENGVIYCSTVTFCISNDERINFVARKIVSKNNYIKTNLVGEVFTEDNPLNAFGEQDNESKERLNFLKRYFNSSSSTLEFSCAPNLSIETGDFVQVETNLYDENEKKIVKTGVVVSFEINYNGSIKQNFVVHEYY